MQRINILFVITKLELGGAQKQLLSLIARLNPKIFRTHLFTAQEGLLIPDALSINGITLKKSRCLERAINPLKDLFVCLEIYLFIKRNKIEIVHTHSSKAGILGRFAAKLAGAKVIIHTVHGWSFNDYQHICLRKLYIWLERLSAYFTHRIIVVSNSDKQNGLNNRIGPEDKYRLIRYGVDYTQLRKEGYSESSESERKKLGITSDCLVVGMVACFKPQKAPLDFIKLASLIKHPSFKVKFILVGDGALRQKIERLIFCLNLKEDVILTGWQRDVYRILPLLDVFVLTSLWEGLPIAVLEAIAFAKPVVATDTGGIREIVIDGRTGFLARPHDIGKMSEKLTLLLKDEALRRKMGQNASKSLDSSNDFRLANMIERTQNLYLNLVGRNNGYPYAN